MTSAELDALAKSLTKAQRAALDDLHISGSAAQSVMKLGLTCGHLSEFVAVTALGLALRNHLRAQEGSAGGEDA